MENARWIRGKLCFDIMVVRARTLNRHPSLTYPATKCQPSDALRTPICQHESLIRKIAQALFLFSQPVWIEFQRVVFTVSHLCAFFAKQLSLNVANMLYDTRTFLLATLLPSVAFGLPFDLALRAKSYSVINVDGGSSAQVTSLLTTTVKATTTIEVQNPAPTVTQAVTTTVTQSVPTVASSSSGYTSSTPAPSTPSSAGKSSPTATPAPIFVTVTVPANGPTTEYYDDGMWHTRYAIKPSDAAGAAAVTASPSVTVSRS